MFSERAPVGSKAEVVDDCERINEAYDGNQSEGKGIVGSKARVVENWEQMFEIWNQCTGTVGSKAEVVESWDQMNEIWNQDGEKTVVMHESTCAAATNISYGDGDALDASEVIGSDEEDKSWIARFCNQPKNKFLCEVDEHYILDDFNLCGLSKQVPHYDHALGLILDQESSYSHEELIESAAELLYGMIHARYLLTFKGFRSMSQKFETSDFGTCPRVYCREQPCLPIGLSDIPRASTVKIYCPQCEDVYDPPASKHHKNVDGAYFGTTFPHLFLMTYHYLKPQKAAQSYVPRVFGFKLHKPSRENQ